MIKTVITFSPRLIVMMVMTKIRGLERVTEIVTMSLQRSIVMMVMTKIRGLG